MQSFRIISNQTLRVLQHAERIGQVAKTCRYFGIGRASFYRWKRAYERDGEAGLVKLKDANLNPLTVPDMIARIPRLATTAAPIDEVEGTATDASSIVFGNYRDLLIGVRHQLEFRLFDSPLATTGQILAVAWMRADVQLARPNSFAPLTGVIPA